MKYQNIKKYLFASIFLGAPVVVGVTNVPLILCNDGSYHKIGYCPGYLYGPSGTNIGTTTADGTVTVDVGEGKLYGCVTSTSTALTAAQIIACSGGAAVRGANTTVTSSGVQTLSVTNLLTGTNYYWQFVHYYPTYPVGWPSNTIVSSQFTTGGSAGYAFDYVGIPYPTQTTTELEALGYTAWPYDPALITVPALPDPWTSDHGGFYYVKAGGTSTSNGNPVTPRATIPTTLAAGSVVIVDGDVGGLQTLTFTANCTAVAPCFIHGVNSGRLTATAYTLAGSHLILDDIDGYFDDGSGSAISISGNYITVRNGDFSNIQSGGVSRGGFGLSGHHSMLYNNVIHDIGNWASATDDNRHGVKVDSGGSLFWIINNTFHDITNDGVQVGDTNTPTVTLGFVAGNIAYSNAQTGLWNKNCYDVIFSTNTLHDHVDDPAGAGGHYFAGGQYDFSNVWWINNNLYGYGGGFYIGSNNGTQTQGPRYFVGNVIHDVTNDTYDVNDSHSPAAFTDRNSTQPTYVVNNTFENNHAGYASPYSTRIVIGNTFSSITASGAAQIFLFSNTGHTANYNLYEGTAGVKFGSSTLGGFSLLTGAGLEANGAESATLTYVNAGTGDYTPTGTAIDAAGTIHAVYSDFQTRYGLSIATDRLGTTRPQNAIMDAGAYEKIP